MTDEERRAFVERVLRELRGGPEAKTQRMREEQQRLRDRWIPPKPQDQQGSKEYTFKWGQCKGWTLAEAQLPRNWSKRELPGTFMSYLRHCFVSGILAEKPVLVASLKEVGLWEEVSKDSKKGRKEHIHWQIHPREKCDSFSVYDYMFIRKCLIVAYWPIHH